MQIFLAIIGGGVGVTALVALSALWRGWILTVLWGWFVMPTFHLPSLGMVAAIGLALVVGFLTHQDIDAQEPERSQVAKWGRIGGLAVFGPALTLGLGWAVHLFA